MKWGAIGLIFAVLDLSKATIQPSTKSASATCLKNVENDSIEFTFKVYLNTDPQGGLSSINNADFNLNPKVFSRTSGCSISYDSTLRIYTVRSVIDLSPISTLNRNSNLCGMTQSTGATAYEWLFLHSETAGSTVIKDRDRAYRIVCTPSNILPNLINTTTTVLTPNLNVPVTPTLVTPTLQVYLKNTNTNSYSLVGPTDTLPAGATVRLQVTLNRGTSYTPNLNVYGVHVYNTETGSSESYPENDFLVNANGCANQQASNRPPFTTNRGFKGSVVTTTPTTSFVLVSGDFRIWKYDLSGRVYFRASYGLCFEPDTARCNDMCLATTNTQERRRRDQTDSRVIETFVNIEFERGESGSNTAEKSMYRNATIIIGATVGSVLLIVFTLLIVVCVLMRRRRTTVGKHRQFDNISHASSLPTVVPVQKM